MALTIRDNHKEDISIFSQMIDLEKALKKEVVAAIYRMYLK